MISIIAIGRKHEPWIVAGIERYQKRLRAPWDVKWELLAHSSLDSPRARQDESERILSRLSPSHHVILLDETGDQLDSPAYSRLLEQRFSTSKQIVFVIGGAYGVSDDLKKRANLCWSLSPLVFPHQMVRLILVEQLYRAQQIAHGSNYHHV